jgi:hypothetical protein
MSTQNLHLKQISCLQSPVFNQGWHEIVQYFPAALQGLVEEEILAEVKQEALAAKFTNIQAWQAKRQDHEGDSIPWCKIDGHQQGENENKPFQLKSFVYDCSYVSPFVSNLYTREHSAMGWYRWVGPNPALEVRLPLAPAECEHWLFTATFHAFLDETHAKNITFKVHGKQKPFAWIEGLTYQSRISALELFGNANPTDLAVILLSIALPEARKASEQDQRMIAFAIRELSLTPA